MAYYEKHDLFSHLKIEIGKHYSFPKLTQLAQGNNVLEAATSNTAVFL
jgi:hypothetical protein